MYPGGIEVISISRCSTSSHFTIFGPPVTTDTTQSALTLLGTNSTRTEYKMVRKNMVTAWLSDRLKMSGLRQEHLYKIMMMKDNADQIVRTIVIAIVVQSAL